VEAFRLAAGKRSVALPLPCGVAVSREAFDAALVQAAVARGADFLPLTRAVSSAGAESARLVRLQQQATTAEGSANGVLAADGLGGTFLASSGIARPTRPRSRIGAGVILDTGEPFYRSGVIYMSCGRHGYVGLVRLEDGRLDVACAIDPRA